MVTPIVDQPRQSAHSHPSIDQTLLDLETRWHQLDRDFQCVTEEMLRTTAPDGSELGQRAEALFDMRCEIETEIARTPANGTIGLAVKLHRYLHWIERDDQGDPKTDDERDIDDHLAVSAARDAIRLASASASDAEAAGR